MHSLWVPIAVHIRVVTQKTSVPAKHHDGGNRALSGLSVQLETTLRASTRITVPLRMKCNR